MKVVFDTNVYISEALFDALAEAIIKAGREGSFSVYICEFIITEIYTVLLNHFKTTRRFARLTADRARRSAHLVPTRNRIYEGLVDDKDNPILEAAINSGADFLVTGDKHLLILSPFQGIVVLGPGDFHRQLKDANLL